MADVYANANTNTNLEAGAGVAAGLSVFELIAADAKAIGANVPPAEIARLAESRDMGRGELEAVAATMSYLAGKKREKAVQMYLNMSHIPQKSPKTFANFDFSRLQGKGCDAIARLPELSNIYARRNLALIGPEGVGKSHLVKAYGRECCMRGMQAYYVKARELSDKMAKAVKLGTEANLMNQLVRPACLIIDEIGRCRFDKECTDLFFHVVDARSEKDGPNAILMTSNFTADKWDECFTGGSTLLCTLDRLFDDATVFMIKGSSFRGQGLETYSVEATPSVSKLPAAK